MWTSNGRYSLMFASRSSTPSSTSVMIPAHVTVLETEASMNAVSGVTRIPAPGRPHADGPQDVVAADDRYGKTGGHGPSHLLAYEASQVRSTEGVSHER